MQSFPLDEGWRSSEAQASRRVIARYEAIHPVGLGDARLDGTDGACPAVGSASYLAMTKARYASLNLDPNGLHKAAGATA